MKNHGKLQRALSRDFHVWPGDFEPTIGLSSKRGYGPLYDMGDVDRFPIALREQIMRFGVRVSESPGQRFR
nr:hypothetical protein [Novosphingobium resinovorum]